MYLDESALGKEYLEYCNLKRIAITTNILDLSNISWFFPTLLLPLGIFIKENNKIDIILPSDINVSKYVNIIMKDKLNSIKSSYIPIVEIHPNRPLIEKKLESLINYQKIHKGSQNAFSYFIGELIDNIYEHSKFSSAYIMAQKYKHRNFTEIGIIDNGISIPGSYESKGYNFNDIEALEQALKGLSTKDYYERGYGLRTSLDILIKGFEAECLIISRGGGLILNKNNSSYIKLEENHIFKGTLISTRLYNINREVNVYEYVEK